MACRLSRHRQGHPQVPCCLLAGLSHGRWSGSSQTGISKFNVDFNLLTLLYCVAHGCVKIIRMSDVIISSYPDICKLQNRQIATNITSHQSKICDEKKNNNLNKRLKLSQKLSEQKSFVTRLYYTFHYVVPNYDSRFCAILTGQWTTRRCRSRKVTSSTLLNSSTNSPPKE